MGTNEMLLQPSTFLTSYDILSLAWVCGQRSRWPTTAWGGRRPQPVADETAGLWLLPLHAAVRRPFPAAAA
jgi:hypothetical protein